MVSNNFSFQRFRFKKKPRITRRVTIVLFCVELIDLMCAAVLHFCNIVQKVDGNPVYYARNVTCLVRVFRV